MRKITSLIILLLLVFCFSGSLFAFDHYANPIRVRLGASDAAVSVTAAFGTYQVLNNSGAEVSRVNPGDSVSLSPGQTLSSVNGYSRFTYGGKEYRGDLIHNGGYIVNRLPMEYYLYSVVSMEIGGYSPGIEALKAQAVASRSYASVKLKNPRSSYYDILATTSDQAYSGYSQEQYNGIGIRIRQACSATENIVCYYDGTLANTIYCANTGGYTEDASVVWGGSYPYMKSIVSPYDSLGFVSENYTSSGTTYKTFKTPTSYQWVRTMTFAEITAKIADIGTVNNISVANTNSGYAQSVTFTGSRGSKTLKGEAVRSALGLRSATFSVLTGKSVSGKASFAQQLLDSNNFDRFLSVANSMVTFEGRGYGHTVGMSQWGACVMAYQGYNYQQILNYYYNQNQNNGRLTLEGFKG